MSDLAETYLRQARSFLLAGEPQRSVELLKKARALSAKDTQVLVTVLRDLTSACKLAGRLEEAGSYYLQLQALVGPEPRDATANARSAPTHWPVRILTICAIMLSIALGAGTLWWLAQAAGSGQAAGGNARYSESNDPPSLAVKRKGLRKEQLGLSSQTVIVQWTARRPGQHDLSGWTDAPPAGRAMQGSTGVIATNGSRLWLVTNLHVLDLPAIEQAKTTDIVITGYDVTVKFRSGQIRRILRIGYQLAGLDLALLQVDATGLTEGTDFVILPQMSSGSPEVGDEVVAVGSPIRLEGTETFGHISAFRENQYEPGRSIQTDAAINHGNSGGPLFVKRGDRYFWVGVNTFRPPDPGQSLELSGLNFALNANQVNDSKFQWYEATKEGTAEALRVLFNFPTGLTTG